MKSLVGYTGFVGQNIMHEGDFDGLYNSKNIADAYGTKPQLLIYSGVRAEKFLANNDPNKDLCQVMGALENIKRIEPKKLCLISTIDVFKNPAQADENTLPTTENLHAYGLNRLKLEKEVRALYPDCLIVRLPALFGLGIKKNFIYDYLTLVPSMLKSDKFRELSSCDGEIAAAYTDRGDGFFVLKAGLSKETLTELKSRFRSLGFTSLQFTDSRSRYQFYPLARLYSDIETAMANGVRLLHTATEPVSAAEVYNHLCGGEFKNELSAAPACYDYRTIHGELFGGEGGYIMSKQQVLCELSRFVKEESERRR